PPGPTLFPYTTLFRSGTAAASALRSDQRDMVVIAGLLGDELLCERLGRRQDFERVAVVEPQDRRAPLGLNADAGEAEFSLLSTRSEEHTSELQSREKL